MMLYLVGSTRPDIAYAVHQCAKLSRSPKRSHDIGVKYIASIMTRVVDDDIVIQIERDIKIYLANLNIFERSISTLRYNLKTGNRNIY